MLNFLSPNQYGLAMLDNNQQLNQEILCNSMSRFIIIINISTWLLFLVLQLVNWALAKFTQCKFRSNQSLNILNTVLILLIKSVGYQWDNKMLVSSTCRIGTDLSLTNLSKLFIKIMKIIGPKIEPWETPCSILARIDDVMLSF